MQSPLPPLEPPRVRGEPRFGEFVALVALMMGLTAFAVDGVLPTFPAMAVVFGVQDPNRMQLVVYVYMLGFGIAQMIYGPASDVVGRRPAYLTGLVVFVIGTVMTLLARDFETLLIARAVQGVGAAAGRVLSTAIVRDRFAGRGMARVMSINMSVFITVPIFAPAIGSALLQTGDWRVLFATMLAASLGLGIWFALRMPETLSDANRMPLSLARIGDGVVETLRARTTVGYATVVGLLFGCVMSLVGSAQQIFAEAYGLGAWFPLAFALCAGSMGGAAVVNASAVGRFGMRRISHTSIVALVLLGAVQLGAAILWGGRPPLALFGILLCVSQFFLGLSFPNCNALAMEPLARIAGTGSSLLGVYTTVFGALCGLLIGALYNGGVLPIAVGYFVLPVMALVAAVVTERGRLFVAHHGPRLGA